MASKMSLRRRILLTVLVVFVVAAGLGIGEVFRRFFEREELAAIRRVLSEARLDDRPLASIDPEWGELSESLRTRLEAEPKSLLAFQAYRVPMRLEYDLPGSISLVEHPTATIKYGDLIGREIPFPDQPYLWTIEIQGSWDNGPWFEWHRAIWDGEGWEETEFALDKGLTDAARERGYAVLRLRSLSKLYLDERATAAANASGSKELASLRFNFQEHEVMGRFRIWTRTTRKKSQEP